MKRWLLAAACGIAALGLMLYPLVGELLSEKYHSDIETVYTAAIENTDDTELTAQRQAAEQYNAMLSGQAAITEGGASAPPLAYAEQLTVGGVMAYVDIPKIGVYLPVQQGTDADTLERAVADIPPEKQDDPVAKGVRMTLKAAADALRKLDVTEVETVKFDPNLHNAVMHVEDDTRGEGEIVDVFQKGYRRGDKVIRFAMVRVAN